MFQTGDGINFASCRNLSRRELGDDHKHTHAQVVAPRPPLQCWGCKTWWPTCEINSCQTPPLKGLSPTTARQHWSGVSGGLLSDEKCGCVFTCEIYSVASYDTLHFLNADMKPNICTKNIAPDIPYNGSVGNEKRDQIPRACMRHHSTSFNIHATSIQHPFNIYQSANFFQYFQVIDWKKLLPLSPVERF
jgi:hypothetical protein